MNKLLQQCTYLSLLLKQHTRETVTLLKATFDEKEKKKNPFFYILEKKKSYLFVPLHNCDLPKYVIFI